MQDHPRIDRIQGLAGRTIVLAAFVEQYEPMFRGNQDIAIRFGDGSYAVLSGYGNDCNGGVSLDRTVRDAHRHALGIMAKDERAAYEARVERERAEEEAADRRELARLQAKLARGRD